MDIDTFKRLFGQRVQTFRRRRQLTQEDLAERIGRSVDMVSNVERGVSSTRIETAFRIAEILGVGLPELFDVGPAVGMERERRELIDRLVELVSGEHAEILAAVIAQTEILLKVRVTPATPAKEQG